MLTLTPVNKRGVIISTIFPILRTDWKGPKRKFPMVAAGVALTKQTRKKAITRAIATATSMRMT